MAYNPSQNYQLVQSGVWPDRRTSLKNSMEGITDVKKCFAVCDSDTNCDGFVFSTSQSRCETYAGTNFSSTHSWVPDGKLYRKTRQQPLGNGAYQGNPLQVGGCCGGGSQDPNTFANNNGARQPKTPNTNGRGSCGGFNGYGGWSGWNNGFNGSYTCCNGCPESFDLSMCVLDLGTPTDGLYVPTPQGGRGDGVYAQCKYSALNWPSLISQGTFNDSKGRELLTEASWEQAKNDYCANWSNIDKTECVQWLQPSSAGSHSYNTVKMGLCTPPNVTDWTTDTRCVNAINQVFKTGSDSEKNMANQMINLACGTNPNSEACACYNATNRSVDECLASPNLPGCKTIADKVGKYKSLGATFLTANLKPFCACDECTKAKTGSAGQYISQPAADQASLCTDKINACFQQVTIGEMSGGNLNAGCTIQDINAAPGSSPSSGGPPSSGGGGSGPPGTPPSSGGGGASLPFKDPTGYLDTKNKQYGAIGGLIFCILICCVIILLAMGGDSGGSSGANAILARLATAGA